MAKEIELKLRLQPEDIPALVSWLDNEATATGQKILNNDYFDTPELALSSAHSALRIRSTNSGFEQTFKARSQSSSGVQVRHEWNWPLPDRQLDSSILALPEVQACWPESAARDQLQTVFSTDFERRSWLYTAADGSEIEVVIDQGSILANGQSEPLCELELELVSGDAAAMWPLSEALHDVAPMWLSDISKAERGYRLAGVGSASFHGATIDAEGAGLPEQAFDLQRALEYYLWSDGDLQAIWQSGYPLARLMSKVSVLWQLLDKSLSMKSEHLLKDKAAAKALTCAVQQVAGMCTESQPGRESIRDRWDEARSQVGDVIECSETSSLSASLKQLLKD